MVIGTLYLGVPIAFAQAYNFGPFPLDNLTVKELVEEAIKVWGKGEFHIPVNTNSLHEATLLQLDISKATLQLDWKPLQNSKLAIHNTIEWYKKYFNNKEYSLLLIKADIIDYCHLKNV